MMMKSQVVYAASAMRSELKPVKSAPKKQRRIIRPSNTAAAKDFQSVPNLPLKPSPKKTNNNIATKEKTANKSKSVKKTKAKRRIDPCAVHDELFDKKKVLEIVDKPKKKAVKKVPLVEVKTVAAVKCPIAKKTDKKQTVQEKVMSMVKCASAKEKPKRKMPVLESPHKSIFDVLKPVKISQDLLMKKSNAKLGLVSKKTLRKKAASAGLKPLNQLSTPISSL